MNIIEIIFYCMGGLILLLLAALGLFIWLYARVKNSDKIIIIDKSNRFTMIERNFKNTDIIPIGKGKTYAHVKDSAILNEKGKGLLIFSDNNPMPMKIRYNSAEWLSSETLMHTINNELIKLMLQLQDKVKDMFIILGAIGGLVAAIASVVIVLRTYGVI